LRSVEDLAVGRQRLDVRVFESVLLQLADDLLGGAAEVALATHAMQSREPFEVPFRRLAGDLAGERRDLRVREE
jgi:hypothetical protein